jgi:hypothetical protein
MKEHGGKEELKKRCVIYAIKIVHKETKHK